MKKLVSILVILGLVLSAPSFSNAQEDKEEPTTKEEIVKVLEHPTVERIAENMEVDLDKAKKSVYDLPEEELKKLVDYAHRIERELKDEGILGVSSTTIIIVLLSAILTILLVK